MIHTFATPAPITAVLEVPAGRLYLAAADRADTTVEIRPADPDKGRDVKLAEQTTADYSDGTLRVAGPDRNKLFGSTGAVEVTVHLPAGSKVLLKAASVQFTTAGQLGDVTLDSAQATVAIEAAASAHLATVDGDVTVGRLDGNAEIRTARGNLQVTEAARGRVELLTQSGAITVGAAAGVSATLDAEATVGRISNALTNAGSPVLEIRATTTVGDITARSL